MDQALKLAEDQLDLLSDEIAKIQVDEIPEHNRNTVLWLIRQARIGIDLNLIPPEYLPRAKAYIDKCFALEAKFEL